MSCPLHTHTPGDPFVPVDYHMHTVYSDGESSIEAYIQRAVEMDLTEIAITDHVWRSSDWVQEYAADVRAIAEEYDIVAHVGLEAKVIDSAGNVDVAATDVETVDFVMGVVHRYQPEASPPNDDMLNFDAEAAAGRERDLTLALLRNETVDVVGHPTRTYYKFFFGEDTYTDYPEEYLHEILSVSKETNTPVEYNARLPKRIREELLQLYVDWGVPFISGSDSHHVDRLRKLDYQRLQNTLV
jgi:putative hydrolase